MTTAEAAAYLRVATWNLDVWREKGLGPRFRRLNGKVRYSIADLDAWAKVKGIKPKGKNN